MRLCLPLVLVAALGSVLVLVLQAEIRLVRVPPHQLHQAAAPLPTHSPVKQEATDVVQVQLRLRRQPEVEVRLPTLAQDLRPTMRLALELLFQRPRVVVLHPALGPAPQEIRVQLLRHRQPQSEALLQTMSNAVLVAALRLVLMLLLKQSGITTLFPTLALVLRAAPVLLQTLLLRPSKLAAIRLTPVLVLRRVLYPGLIRTPRKTLVPVLWEAICLAQELLCNLPETVM